MGFGVKPVSDLQKKAEAKKNIKEDVDILQISQEELIRLFIEYNIPVARETVIAIKQHPMFLLKK